MPQKETNCSSTYKCSDRLKIDFLQFDTQPSKSSQIWGKLISAGNTRELNYLGYICTSVDIQRVQNIYLLVHRDAPQGQKLTIT